MTDLLAAQLSAGEIAAILRRKPLQPLFPPMDASAWREAAARPFVQRTVRDVIAQAEKEFGEPLPELTDELYEIFHKTGERLTFETLYFERRRRLARAATAMLLGDEKVRAKLLPVLLSHIEQTMQETSWTFPAHSGQPSGKDPMKIDLFAAETANLMGELYSVFGAALPDKLVTRIRERVRTQYTENYLANTFMWQAMTNNWNAVCHQGVIGAALALETDLDLVAKVIAAAAPRLQTFLTGFGDDGHSSEGPGYWSYGFGRFCELNEQLETATAGELSIIGDNEKIRRIAKFAPNLVFSGGHFVNFADGAATGRLNAALLEYLGHRLKMPELNQDAAAIYRQNLEEGINLSGQRCDFFFYTRAFLRSPADVSNAVEPARPDVYYPDYGAIVARGRDKKGNLWEFAAKGGHNEEHHNHNDCGGFLINLNGHRAIIDIGAPEYVREFFKIETRYDFLAARSLGHSVPLVNGVEQHVGIEYAAKVTKYETMPGGYMMFQLDLTQCYPPSAQLVELTRIFCFNAAEGIFGVSDHFKLKEKGSVESMIIVEAPVCIEGTNYSIETPGGRIHLIRKAGTNVRAVDDVSYRGHGGREFTIHRISLGHDEPCSEGALQYSFSDIPPQFL